MQAVKTQVRAGRLTKAARLDSDTIALGLIIPTKCCDDHVLRTIPAAHHNLKRHKTLLHPWLKTRMARARTRAIDP